MDLWLLYSDAFDNNTFNPAIRMLNEAIAYKLDAKLLFYPYFRIIDDELYYHDELIKELPRVIFMRGQDYPLVKFFEKNNVKCINSSFTITACRDKWQTHQIVDSHGIPQIKTIKATDDFNYNAIALGLPFILKIRGGCQGKNIYLINDEEQYKTIIKNLDLSEYIAQPFIKDSYGKDLRLYIVGNKVIGAVKRENNSGSFMSNLAQGGLSYHYELDDNLIQQSLKIKDALKGDIISVDYVFSKSGLLFCEANTNAGFASFNFLGYPMRKIFMEYIKELID